MASERSRRGRSTGPRSEETDWQDVVWRELANTRDPDRATNLFDLVADKPLSGKASLGLAAVGSMLGALLSSAAGAIVLGSTQLALPLGPFAAAGGAIGALTGRKAARLLTPRHLVSRSFLIGCGLMTLCSGFVTAWGAVAAEPLLRPHLDTDAACAIALAIAVVGFVGGAQVGSSTGQARRRLALALRRLWVWWRGRPRPDEVREAVHRAWEERGRPSGRWKRVIRETNRLCQTKQSPEVIVRLLDSPSWENRLAARLALADLGGEAVAALTDVVHDGSREVIGRAERLLRSIARQTNEALTDDMHEWLCPTCVVRCRENPVSIPRRPDTTYIGCRSCGRSRDLLKWPGQVVAVLDKGTTKERTTEGDTLRVNWFEHGHLFDFDSVEIANATDEQVERFAMATGNDTDEVRRGKYSRMRCSISTRCPLPENTIRILRSQFGEVMVETGDTT